MTHTLGKMISHPEEYKICDICGCVNWGGNNYCTNNCINPTFHVDSEKVANFIEETYRYWKEAGYSNTVISNITKGV